MEVDVNVASGSPLPGMKVSAVFHISFLGFYVHKLSETSEIKEIYCLFLIISMVEWLLNREFFLKLLTVQCF